MPASYFKATVTTKSQTNAFTATATNAGYCSGPPNALSITAIAGTQEIDLGLAPYTLGQTQTFDFHCGISIATWKPTGQFLINNPTSKYGYNNDSIQQFHDRDIQLYLQRFIKNQRNFYRKSSLIKMVKLLHHNLVITKVLNLKPAYCLIS